MAKLIEETTTIVAKTTELLFKWNINDFGNFKWTKDCFLTSKPLEIEGIDEKVYFRINPTTYYNLEFNLVKDPNVEHTPKGNYSFQVFVNDHEFANNQNDVGKHFRLSVLGDLDSLPKAFTFNFKILCHCYCSDPVKKVLEDVVSKLASSKNSLKVLIDKLEEFCFVATSQSQGCSGMMKLKLQERDQLQKQNLNGKTACSDAESLKQWIANNMRDYQMPDLNDYQMPVQEKHYKEDIVRLPAKRFEPQLKESTKQNGAQKNDEKEEVKVDDKREEAKEDDKKEEVKEDEESDFEECTDYDSMALLNNYFVINNIFERGGTESENLAEAEKILNDFTTMDNFYSVIYATDFFSLSKAREIVVKNFIVKQSYKDLKESNEWKRLKKNQNLYLNIVDLILTNCLKGNRTIIF